MSSITSILHDLTVIALSEMQSKDVKLVKNAIDVQRNWTKIETVTAGNVFNC
ncbi:unnamed protein product [Gemmata massiliana]|uniref:Uncharacterized protein n=1 Tax=Gemmata massiliana TaxID=1210884 RepID=A0A6P2DHJ5_9BACT|nr:unnamed protein product [Gemmata massiliana]